MQLRGLGQTVTAKEAHLDSVRLTHGIRATRRNDLGNSGLRGPITSESPMRELVCCIQGLIFSRLHRRIRGIREAEQVGLLLHMWSSEL
jgi:hypothetical protein